MQSVTTKIKPIPSGYHSVTPYLVVDGAPKLLDFVKRAFNAEELSRMNGPDGRVAHAEVKIGDSIVMMSDSTKEFPPAQTQLYVYVDDTDTTYKRALESGAVKVQEPKNQFYGDRNASVRDPLGNIWGIGTHVEDVSPEEMKKRMKALRG
jgi:PhnB protein